MVYGHFQSTRAYDRAQALSDLFSICLQDDDGQHFDTRWDQILAGTSEIPPENVIEGLYTNRFRKTFRTVIAMYNQELSRDRVVPSYQKFQTPVVSTTSLVLVHPLLLSERRHRSSVSKSEESVKNILQRNVRTTVVLFLAPARVHESQVRIRMQVWISVIF